MTRILHFADLHLDSVFAWAGGAAIVRRENLRKTLRNIVDLAKEVESDALFCGGDLYEHDRVTPDTGEFLRATFAALDPMPVFLAPGNHDWYGPESLYALVKWTPNVHVFREPRFTPVSLADGLTLWGAAHQAPANTDNFLDGFNVRGPETHVALFHGAEKSWLTQQGEGKLPHAPFDTTDIEAAGFSHAFLGHYHRPRDAERHTYPGNPDPLEFGEDEERGPVIATIDVDGKISRERRRVAVTETHDIVLDITGCTNRQDARDRLAAQVHEMTGFARLTVQGEWDPTMDLSASDLGDTLDCFHAVQIRFGQIHTAYDVESLAKEPTVQGQFVRDVISDKLPPDEERRVLMTGLRALGGRVDLEVL
ncbi:MAG: metallophosphoesterase [Gammaproteobacteria bacterium]|nr:metallophosphoesterase [Gammaproteobacteria bacterium]